MKPQYGILIRKKFTQFSFFEENNHDGFWQRVKSKAEIRDISLSDTTHTDIGMKMMKIFSANSKIDKFSIFERDALFVDMENLFFGIRIIIRKIVLG